jgi:hypothetical protein
MYDISPFLFHPKVKHAAINFNYLPLKHVNEAVIISPCNLKRVKCSYER